MTIQHAAASRAPMSAADQNDLPDSCFAYVEPGGTKDESGRTVPRSKRHLPYLNADGGVDVAHLRNALARLSQTDIPDTAKASALKKLKAAAKKAGVEVSDETGRGTAAEATRAIGTVGTPDAVERVFVAPISRIDAEKRLVTVTATTESVDSYGTVFDYEASKKAFTEWLGNVREMHQPKAVGTRVAVNCDDAERKIDVTLRVSRGAQDTWEKILDGTLRGASIGASNVVWEHPRGTGSGGPNAPRARAYSLVELSLVDNASNPDANNLTVMRNAVPDASYLDVVEEDAQEDAQEGDANAGTDTSAASSEPVTPDAPESAAAAEAAAAAAVESDETVEVPEPSAPGAPEESERMASATTSTVGIPGLDGTRHETVGAAELGIVPDAPDDVADAVDATDATDAAAALTGRYARLDPSSPEGQLQIARYRRQRDAEAVRLAGDAAVAEFGPRERNEDPGLYFARLAKVRGQAELMVLHAQQQRQQHVAQAIAPTVEETVPAAEETARVAELTVAATTDATPAEPAAERAMVAMNDTMDASTRPSDAQKVREATSSAPMNSSRTAHTHGHAHMGFGSHQHDHEHTHLDGTTHSHAHLHGHDHHDLHEDMAPDMSHDHEHTHLHDHSHSFRAGQATDTRIAQAETAERAKATAGSAGTAVEKVDKGASSQQPASGSQFGKVQDASSPSVSVQPQNTGHLVLPNTQDAEAKGFGVPPMAPEPETPSDSDELRIDPDDLHEGGHAPAPGWTEGTMDDDGDHDGDEDMVANGGEYDEDGDHDGGAAGEDSPRSPDEPPPAATPIAGSGQANSRPLPADKAGRQPADATALDTDGIPGGHRSAASTGTAQAAQDTRAGARNSAKDTATLHSLRDGQLGHLETTCKLCGCPTCQGVLTILNGGGYDSDGDHDGDAEDQPITGDDVASFGQQRMLLAAVERVNRAREQALLGQVSALLSTLGLHLTNQLTNQLQSVFESRLDARLADVELTIQDGQSALRAEVAQTTRAQSSELEAFSRQVTTGQEHANAAISTHLTQLPELMRAMESTSTSVADITQRLERVAADAAELRAAVERIEQQPVASGGPLANAMDYAQLAQMPQAQRMQAIQALGSGRFASSGAGGANGASLSVEERIAAIQAAMDGVQDPAAQVTAAGMIVRLQQSKPRQ